MTPSSRIVVVLVISIALLTLTVNALNSRPPRNNDISSMADALKYLQDLDNYYADRARVRFGKRATLSQLLRNRLLDCRNSQSPAIDQLLPAVQPY